MQPRRGSFPEVVGKTGGGVLSESDDAAGLADAMYDLWKTPGAAADLGLTGAHGVRAQYSAGRMAARALEVRRTVVPHQTRP